MISETRELHLSGKDGSKVASRDAIKQLLYSKLGQVFDDESKRAAEEMRQERESAIKVIIEEQKSAIRQIVENEKKAIWTTAMDSKQLEDYSSEVIKDIVSQSYSPELMLVNSEIGHNQKAINYEEKIELEILPPRDQNEIATINTYLINQPELSKVELITQIDKSIFRVVQKEPINLVEKLNTLPQVVSAKESLENNQKKITITLLAKSKLDKNNNEMAEKVNKIFYKKK